MATYPADKEDDLEAVKVNEPVTMPVQQAEIPNPQTDQVTVNPVVQTPHLYDYNNISLAEAYNKGEHTPRDIMLDRVKWGEENDKPMNWVEASYFQNKDLDKNKKDAEKEEKRKKWEDAFEHLGNVLMTFGNFVGSVAGAPAPSNMVDPKALTERQRKLRDYTRAQRDAYNKDFFANYWKERAEERQRERDKALANYRIIQGQAAQQRADDNRSKTEKTNELTDARIKKEEATTNQINELTPVKKRNYEASAKRSMMAGSAAVTRANKAKDYNTNSGSGGTPPSRRSKNQNNTPPSRRR